MKLFKMKLIAAATAGALALLTLGHEAQAETYTVTGTVSSSVTDYSKSVSVDTFNVSLGQLVSVTITLSTGASTTIDLTNNSASSSNGSIYSTTALTLADADSLLSLRKTLLLAVTSISTDPDTGVSTYNGTNYSLGSGGSTVVTSSTTGTKTATYTTAPVLTEFSSSTSDKVNFTLSTSSTTTQANTGGNTAYDQTTVADAGVSVTYTYNAFAPIPEPSTWGMVFGGIATLVLVQRVRRHRTV